MDFPSTYPQVKTMPGLGTTVDCVLVNGKLREGDKVVLCGLSGAIVTRIKALKTPQVCGCHLPLATVCEGWACVCVCVCVCVQSEKGHNHNHSLSCTYE